MNANKTHAQNVSEPVRKEKEKTYGFVPSDKKEQKRKDEKQLVTTPQKIQAGKSAPMCSITNVLDYDPDSGESWLSIKTY